MTRRACRFLLAAFLVCAAACSSSSGADKPNASVGGAKPLDAGVRTRVSAPGGGLTLETTSTRARYVSGGDVLVTVSGAGAADAVVTANGKDVDAAFTASGGARRGLIAGLRDGANVIAAKSDDTSVKIDVTNHSKNGPMFAGPHLEPWLCTTEAAGLGPATDADCDAPTKTTWSYKATDGSVKPLADPASTPADVASTMIGGTSVPFVIRTEQGVIDRGIYTIWTLDPKPKAAAGATWDASGWNHRLVYRFGGGCGNQYTQGSSFIGGADTDLLGSGYAVATNTLDTLQTTCNTVLSAEAALMTREHFVEAYGVPKFTIGDGGSGGAIQQLTIAHAYPGILDGLSPSLPFPDSTSIAAGVTDCGLLVHYYKTATGAALTDAQKVAINGHLTSGTCESWDRLFVGGVNPTDGCDAIGAAVYNAVTNPKGARCSLADMNVNILGVDPKTGFANRPLDNIGVQYGLLALRAGAISVDQFLDVNAGIGGYDIDGNIVPQREAIDAKTAAIAYQVGAVTGAGPLQHLPIILRNFYSDAVGDIHTRFHAFSIRERLKDGGKDDPNLVLWTAPSANVAAQLLGNTPNSNAPVVLLDQWLTTGKKPADAVNTCTLPDGKKLTGGWDLYDDPGPCADAYPIKGDPRTAAGEGIRDEIIKCTLQPVDPGSYGVAFTDAQAQRLQSIFPDGVCDWTKPAVGAQQQKGTWQDYSR